MGWLVTKVITYRMDQKTASDTTRKKIKKMGRKGEEWLSGRKTTIPQNMCKGRREANKKANRKTRK